MDNIRPILQSALPAEFSGVGSITSIRSDAPYCMVRLWAHSKSLEVPARKAAGLREDIVAGDRVLCVSGADRTIYITMLLERNEPESLKHRPLPLQSGGDARVVAKDDREVLAVYNKRNELIFEYDPTNDRSRVVVESGSLDLAAPDGDISLDAGGRIVLDGRTIAMAAGDSAAVEKSTLNMGQFKTELKSSAFNVKSACAQIEFGEALYLGKKLLSRVTRGHFQWQRLQTLADNVVSKFKSNFIDVEGLNQTKAGRLRTLVSGTYRVKAERVDMKSDKAVNIDGERINLG